ncbi:MAG: thymidine phosphorylase [Nitrospirae bacterium]|nr:thymidine phosphorylase [Nitrospirota bacterium]
MRAYEIIKKKRDGGSLDKEEFQFLIRGYLSGEIPDYQMSAFLMAAFLRGLNEEETVSLTDVMLRTGEVLDLTEMDAPRIDKHSTGGVGDKVSIILAPLVAAAGVAVPMISGRGLGHTGGTLDKLESIPGFRTEMSIIDFRHTLWEGGAAIMGQTDDIAPADRRLYALRDVTATVESIPLIASSIMSKKLAEGLNGLVLDVKVGSGAFMKTMEDAEALASVLTNTGNSFGVRTVAVITDMDEPLGRAVGNALEIKECINVLKGRSDNDLLEVTLTLGAWMLYIADWVQRAVDNPGTEVPRITSVDEVALADKRAELEELIETGKALESFVDFVERQGGNPEIIANPGLLPGASQMKQVQVSKSGYIQRVDAEKVGTASMLLGAGRQRLEDGIDHAAGIMLNRKSGAAVQAGDTVAVLHYNDDGNLSEALRLVGEAFEIGPEPPGPRRMIRKVVL